MSAPTKNPTSGPARVIPDVPAIDAHVARARQIIDRCAKLASFTETPGATCRTFLSAPMRDVHREIASWLAPLGVDVRIDAAGNLRALYPGREPASPRLLIGSHLDTVPDAGAYDGILGVVLAVSLLEALDGRRLPFAIEVVGFSEEEGVRFGVPFIGSRALVGRLDDILLERKDPQGTTVRAAIESFGLNPRDIPAVAIGPETFGYLEFHIEQGPVLEDLGHPLGVVEAIAGQSRLAFTFTGRANHAGTTPMHLRLDAVACAAEWITEVEREALRVPGLTATVGKFESVPGAPNVIAKEAFATFDLRHGSDDVRLNAEHKIVALAEQIAAHRGLSVRHTTQMNQPSVKMDGALVAIAEQAVRGAGCEPVRIVSGAGHDAMILAAKIPAAMVFLRSPGGISHNPAETVQVDDIARAIETGLRFLDLLASSPISQRSPHRA